jgi:hypothetical protein
MMTRQIQSVIALETLRELRARGYLFGWLALRSNECAAGLYEWEYVVSMPDDKWNATGACVAMPSALVAPKLSVEDLREWVMPQVIAKAIHQHVLFPDAVMPTDAELGRERPLSV